MRQRIVVIEDQEDNWDLADLRQSAGYEMPEALTGEEGVIAAETHRPDLILTLPPMPLSARPRRPPEAEARA